MSTEQPNLQLNYTGDKGPLFNLAFQTGLLTVLTLGIYRFWQKTRIRKYIWSSVSADGDTFEYTGTGLEKFLGFLIAIVFLALYLGVIQMVLFYFGLNIMVNPDTGSEAEILGQLAAIYISIFAVLPFILYATYRARRYKMARTRFRGIRCGMEKGAWGYVWRAMMYGFLNMITLGILSPLSTFKLEKYMTDKSFYGSTRLTQNGKWTELYPAMKHVFIGLGILVLSVVLLAAGAAGELIFFAIIGGIAMFVGYIWIMIGSVIYSVRSFAYLTSHKRLGDQVSFIAQPRSGEIIKTFILGGLLLSLLSSVVFGIVFGVAAVVGVSIGEESMAGLVILGIFVAVGYLVGLAILQALSLILITQPILAHYVNTIDVVNPEALNWITQREAETGVDAEGFADALDIGGAI